MTVFVLFFRVGKRYLCFKKRRKTTMRDALRVLLFLMILGLALSPLVHAQTNRYVALDGSDVGDCSDEGNPCATFAYALFNAVDGDTVVAEAGTFTESSITIDKHISILGAGATATIIEGAASAWGASDRSR